MVLWRHGRSVWNATRRFQGQTDVPLDETGVAQAERSAQLLAAMSPTAIVSSDLQRSYATAGALAVLTGLPVSVDPRLRETFAGEWQGLTMTEIAATYPAEVDAWDAGAADARPGGGETRQEVAARMVAAVEEAAASLAEDATLVVATHGGAARVCIGRMLGLPPDTWTALGGLSNCCWSVLERSKRGWRLVEHNAGTLPQPVLATEG